ncbi:ABC transporter ATP-binding protein [Candidatus Saccharibacteria bacterium]|nr:ABC transporter ATP-binding protein [Candidatus Saccharibacteria bacterium]
MNVIELTEITKSFGLGNGATMALEQVSLSVPKGEFLVIMGPSGSGKSTLLNIIGLLDTSDDGIYKLDGKDVSYLSARKSAKIRRNNIGFIFQNFNLIGRLNVLENVSLPLMYKGVSTVKRYERASEILKYLGIQEKEYYLPNQLSGGQLQRAAIARAMVNRPSIVLADEPTGNLDTKASKLIMAALREIHEAGNTIIMVTHNPDLAAYADRIIKMVDGRIEEDLTGGSLTKDIAEQRKEATEIAKTATEQSISAKKKPRKKAPKKEPKGAKQ